LRSWSLHAELPGMLELCIWRRLAVNVVERVASFQTEVIKGTQIIHVPATPVDCGDFLGIKFPILGAAALSYDDGQSSTAPVAVLATVSVDQKTATMDGPSSRRRYSICAHVDPDMNVDHVNGGSTPVKHLDIAASSRTEILKPWFNHSNPPTPESVSVYSCGGSIGLVTEGHVWGFARSSPDTFSLCGYSTIDTRACGPSTSYDATNNFLWSVDQCGDDIKQFSGKPK
jgi:hypothetical protein